MKQSERTGHTHYILNFALNSIFEMLFCLSSDLTKYYPSEGLFRLSGRFCYKN